MRLNTKVIHAEWIQEEGLCIYHDQSSKTNANIDLGQVTLENGGRLLKDTCDVLINGSGVVNNW